MLKQQKDKFWKIDSIYTEQQYNINNKFGNFKPQTQPQQPPYKQYNNQQQPYRSKPQIIMMKKLIVILEGIYIYIICMCFYIVIYIVFRYDGYQDNVLKEDAPTPIHTTTTHTKLKEGKHKKLKFGHHIKDKKHKKHKRGA